VRWYFEKARKKIGREEIRMHDLRHTFASWIASDPNIAPAMLRDLLGHSSLLVTDKYTHLQGNTFEAVSRTLKGDNGVTV
jgi:integrase